MGPTPSSKVGHLLLLLGARGPTPAPRARADKRRGASTAPSTPIGVILSLMRQTRLACLVAALLALSGAWAGPTRPVESTRLVAACAWPVEGQRADAPGRARHAPAHLTPHGGRDDHVVHRHRGRPGPTSSRSAPSLPATTTSKQHLVICRVRGYDRYDGYEGTTAAAARRASRVSAAHADSAPAVPPYPSRT